MIFDEIKNWKFYHFSPGMAKAFEFLENMPADIENGKHEIDGTKIYANVMSYDTLVPLPDKLEVHRKYIDLQFAISGREVIAYTPANTLPVLTPYVDADDYSFLAMPHGHDPLFIETRPGNFAIFFPQDAHMGRIASKHLGPHVIRKVVVKIDISLF